MEFHLFPPPKSCLSVILLCFPPLLSRNIFLRNVSAFTKPGTCGKHSPQSSTPSKQKSSRNLFYFSRNAFHAIFNTTRALGSREYTNSWKFPCKPNVSMIEKGETGALPHLREFFWELFFWEHFGFPLGIFRIIHSTLSLVSGMTHLMAP